MLALRFAKAAAGGKLPWIFGKSCDYGVAWSMWPSQVGKIEQPRTRLNVLAVFSLEGEGEVWLWPAR